MIFWQVGGVRKFGAELETDKKDLALSNAINNVILGFPNWF